MTAPAPVKQSDIAEVYLSGPMTGLPEFNYPTFHAAAARLRAAGYRVYSPSEDANGQPVDRSGLTGHEKASDIGFDLRAAFADYARHITTTACAVAVLPGWENSSGARGEVALAQGIGLPIIDALTGEPVRAAFDVKVRSADVLASMERHPAGKGRGRKAVDLIGMSGYAQSGKDTVGEILARRYGFTLVSPSNVLREFLYAQNLYLEGGVDEFGQHQPPARLNDVVDLYGWDMARKVYPEVRVLQQKTGTEAGRDVLHEDVWLDALVDRFSPGAKHVSTSVRYLNEARFITERGGVIIRVNRPGVEAVNDHSSDTEMDDWDFDHVIENDGSLDDLAEKVAALVAELGLQ